MEQNTSRPPQTTWIGVALLVAVIATFLLISLKALSTRTAIQLPVIDQVADFSLTNQADQLVTLDALRGKVWLADIIFTRCPGPCERMTRQMASIQTALPKDSAAKLVSLTTDPDFDSPEVLTQYGIRHNADFARWQFLTGTKQQIGDLATKSLKLAAVEKPEAERASPDDLFVHSTIFVLVDKQARLRGIYQTGGEDVQWTNVQPTIIAAIDQLERAE